MANFYIRLFVVAGEIMHLVSDSKTIVPFLLGQLGDNFYAVVAAPRVYRGSSRLSCVLLQRNQSI